MQSKSKVFTISCDTLLVHVSFESQWYTKVLSFLFQVALGHFDFFSFSFQGILVVYMMVLFLCMKHSGALSKMLHIFFNLNLNGNSEMIDEHSRLFTQIRLKSWYKIQSLKSLCQMCRSPSILVPIITLMNNFLELILLTSLLSLLGSTGESVSLWNECFHVIDILYFFFFFPPKLYADDSLQQLLGVT